MKMQRKNLKKLTVKVSTAAILYFTAIPQLQYYLSIEHK